MGLRITDSYMARLMVRGMQSNLAQMLRYQQMNSTMRRLNSYADDPRGVGAIQRYDTLIDINAQYQANLDRARTFVEATDTALQDLTDVLRDARDIAMRESSASGTDSSNVQSAEEVDSLVGRLMNTLNASIEGNFIFAGFRTNLTPFVTVDGRVQYQGDSGEIPAQVGPHTLATVNIPGSAFMGSASAVLRGTLDIAPPLNGTMLLGGLNLGRGWTAGSIEVTDGTGHSWTIDLSGATDVDSVVAQVAARTAGQVTAAIAPGGRGLQLSGTGPLTVAEVDGGTTAQSLGLLGSAEGGTLIGQDIRPAPVDATPLSDVPTLAGRLPLGSIVIGRDGQGWTVDLSSAVTFGDLRALIAGAVPGMQLEYDDGVLTLVGDGVEAFEVTNAAGSTTAADLGLQGVGAPARLFGVLEDLRAALAARDKDAVRALLRELSAVEDMVLGLTVQVGGREVLLDWMDGVLQGRDEQLQQNRSLERDADVIETATELSKAEAAYQASLLAASRLFQTNLMKYLG